jgi:hypothetical protein
MIICKIKFEGRSFTSNLSKYDITTASTQAYQIESILIYQ